MDRLTQKIVWVELESMEARLPLQPLFLFPLYLVWVELESVEEKLKVENGKMASQKELSTAFQSFN